MWMVYITHQYIKGWHCMYSHNFAIVFVKYYRNQLLDIIIHSSSINAVDSRYWVVKYHLLSLWCRRAVPETFCQNIHHNDTEKHHETRLLITLFKECQHTTRRLNGPSEKCKPQEPGKGCVICKTWSFRAADWPRHYRWILFQSKSDGSNRLTLAKIDNCFCPLKFKGICSIHLLPIL